MKGFFPIFKREFRSYFDTPRRLCIYSDFLGVKRSFHILCWRLL